MRLFSLYEAVLGSLRLPEAEMHVRCLQIKVCGCCCLCSAVLCVVVTVTTTVIHMNRLQTLRECVYQVSQCELVKIDWPTRDHIDLFSIR